MELEAVKEQPWTPAQETCTVHDLWWDPLWFQATWNNIWHCIMNVFLFSPSFHQPAVLICSSDTSDHSWESPLKWPTRKLFGHRFSKRMFGFLKTSTHDWYHLGNTSNCAHTRSQTHTISSIPWGLFIGFLWQHVPTNNSLNRKLLF